MGTRVWVAGALVLAALVLADRFAYYSPKSTLGWNRFRLLYDASSDKSAYLDDFRAHIWEHGGGYIPDRIAGFLNERLESSRDPREVSAIVRFYSNEAGGREGGVTTSLSDQARRRVAENVMRDWKTYPQWGKEHGFVLLEGLRQNTYLGKANVIGPRLSWPASTGELAPVAELLSKWNRRYAAVPFTKRPNPLAGTPYRIEGL